MQIVTDTGMDLTSPQKEGWEDVVHYVPLSFTLDGKTYRSGVDIQADEFYQLLASTDSFPTTSQPAPGDFVEVYRKVAKTDPDILSIHISSGLSGTINSATTAQKEVSEANVTIIDTKTLSGAEGWQVEAAGRAIKAGWSKDKTISLVEKVRNATNTVFTLATLDYLIHGGRISHMRGLIANALAIRPLIFVEKENGTYIQKARARTLKRAILKLADVVAESHPPGSEMRIQILHGNNEEGATIIRERLDELYKVNWLPSGSIAPVLGAHTGPGLVGVAYGAEEEYQDIPS